MNWLVFLVVAWVSFGLEMALVPVFDAGSGGVHPSTVTPLLVFVALYAPRRHALWGAILLGVTWDLLSPLVHADGGGVVLVGPHALGSLLGAQLVFSVRGMVVRRNPLTIAVLSVLAALAAQSVVVAIVTVRASLGDYIAWDASDELVQRAFSSVYTGIAGLVLSFAYFALTPAFGFHSAIATRFARTMHAR